MLENKVLASYEHFLPAADSKQKVYICQTSARRIVITKILRAPTAGSTLTILLSNNIMIRRSETYRYLLDSFMVCLHYPNENITHQVE